MRPFFFGGLYDHRAAGLSNRRSAKPDPGGRLSVKMQICVIQRKHGHELAWPVDAKSSGLRSDHVALQQASGSG
jgi:hypothetical protein